MRGYMKIGVGVVALLFLSMISGSNERSGAFIEMEVKAVSIDPMSQNPVVILMDKEGRKALPIWIGPTEASAIERELTNVTTMRPMTHDLFHSVLGRLKAKVKEVRIVDLKDQTYYAVLFLVLDKEVIEVDARPSDAIVLALKAKAPLSVAAKILENQGVSLASESKFGQRRGIRVQELTAPLASQFDFKGQKGVLVSEIVSDSPAEASGIRTGDIITKIDSNEIGSVQEFEKALDAATGTAAITVAVFREGKFIEVRLPSAP